MSNTGMNGSVNVLDARKKGGRMDGQLMTVKEVAEYLRLKPLAIYRMVKRRFDKKEIDQWMKWGR